jgi:lipoprotein-releasing system ATP-binding protein
VRVIGEGLSHAFGENSPLTDLTFEFCPGDMVGVTGLSGSGKSTLLSFLGGWEQPRAGSIVREDIQSIGWVFQNPHGVPGRTSLDHVSLPILAHGLSRRRADDRAREILGRFGLSGVAEQAFRELSGGEAQRLMLARAVAKSPHLLLVDEPTAQLDPFATQTVNAVLGELASENMIVVVATHDPDTARAGRSLLELGSHANA